ncbi:MAG: fasciclin domain-containing protein [Caldilineaceae bacterium]|nr:fasciclin domain-containing protein [Caldilineaceae bacterium]
MNAIFKRRHVAIRIVASLVLLAISFVLVTFSAINAQDESRILPEAGTPYVIQPGDTMARVAAHAYNNGELYQALCDFNEIKDCNNIGVGTTIDIPTLEALSDALDIPLPTSTPIPTPTPTPAPTPTPTPAPDPASQLPADLQAQLITIAAGDTLADLAAANYNNATVAGRLCAYNMLPDCSELEPGIRIFIPPMEQLLFGTPQQYLPPAQDSMAAADPTGTVAEPEEAVPTDSPTTDTDTDTEPAAPAAADSEDATVEDSTGTPPAEPTPETVPTPVPPTPTPLPPVIVDPESLTIAEYVDQDFRLEIYAFALTLSPVLATLGQDGPYTLLAPSDAAWVAADTTAIKSIFSSLDSLAEFNRSHVLSGDLSLTELANAGTATSISGRVWTVTQTDQGRTLIGNARVVATVSTPKNGTIYILDTLIR